MVALDTEIWEWNLNVEISQGSWVGCQKLDTGASPGGLMQGGGGLMQGVVTSEHYN